MDGIELQNVERALAASYAPPDRRAGLQALFALDERMGAIVAAARDPTIGLMRLLWWRDALAALDTRPPPAEPLLTALAGCVVAPGVAGEALAGLEQGWAALLDGPIDADAVDRHARGRGETLFATAAAVLGASDARLAALGAAWASADLAHRSSDPAVRALARARGLAALPDLSARWSRAARPLAAVGSLVARDLVAEAPRRQGAPGRVARMLVMRLTGR